MFRNRQCMSTIRLSTSFNIDIEFPAASFPRRLLAWALDFLVLFLYVMILIKFQQTFMPGKPPSQYLEGIMTLVYILPVGFYHLICEVFLKGRSVGKMIMQLRVINENGGRPSVSQVIIRWMIRTSDIMIILIFFGTLSGIGGSSLLNHAGIAFLLFIADVILVNMTEKNQRLGDLLARTMLIRTTQKATISETIFQQVHEQYVPQFTQVMRLSDRDINALKNILVSARKNNDHDLAERAAEKVQRHLGITYNGSPFDFIDTLLKDYNYLTAH